MHGRSKWLAAIASGCLSVALGAVGCRQIVGFEEPRRTFASFDAGGSPDAGASACGLPWSTAECASCVHANANCCDVSSVCSADPECAVIYKCLGGCALGDWACRSRCWANRPWAEIAELPTLWACTAAKCGNECQLPCGSLFGPYLAEPEKANDCQRCLAGMGACGDVQACESSIDCVAYGQCVYSLPSGYPFCLVDGGLAPPTVTPDLNAKIVPELAGCSGECGFGSDWSCVGHVKWPTETFGAVTLSPGVVEDFNGQPLAGVTVSACRFQDRACSMPLNPQLAVTDDAGGALLQIPATNADIALNANSYLQASLQGYATTLQFWGTPINVPQFMTIGYQVLLTTMAAQAAVMPSNVTLDPTRAGIHFTVFDCTRAGYLRRAPAVVVSLEGVNDPAVREYYNIGTVANLDFSATQTDSVTAAGGFANVPVDAGVVTVIATPVGLGMVSSRQTVVVRAGTLTQVSLPPTP